MRSAPEDPYLMAAFGLRNKAGRALWAIIYFSLFITSPKPFFFWRKLLLQLFGAKLGRNVAIYPSVRIWAPWNLYCEDAVAIAPGAEIYNPKKVYFGSHAIISQNSYICGATHDYNLPEFPLISCNVHVGRYAWVCARAVVMPGVTLGDGAVLGASAVATKDLEAWCVYAGIPARYVKERVRHDR